MHDGFAGQFLEALDRDIDVRGIDLHRVSTPAGSFRGQNGGAASGKGIQDDRVPLGAVEDGVGDQRHRLNGGMRGQIIEPTFVKGVGTRVVPDVGSIPPCTPSSMLF